MARHPVQVAVAILHQDGQYLMQLRDDTPGILYPKCWAFFGGHLEGTEDPETGLRRELMEEIGYAPPEVTLFRQWGDEQVHRFVYHGPLTVPLEALQLNEGWDLGLLSPEDIRRGDRYSAVAQQTCPLGEVHQKLLLDFLEIHPHLGIPT
ncbi:MAG: NUDIX domain-containing protein [Elainellaceae cyanobacterium]|jgi:8-oxo-dGTP pyrophosphatase MutT (NUDIX family)